MHKTAKSAVALIFSASAILGGIASAGPASAGSTPPPFPVAADCGGGLGDVGTHVLTLKNNTVMRKYNNSTAQVVATLRKGKRLHLFYWEQNNNFKQVWAARAYTDSGKYVCGYVYPDYIAWNTHW
ncbi:hypothetical protein [Streptomyces sp. NBC_00859]|uniref:hypothetical protein n=1 Tax=Streptomyces sp. NBC_00859 TaxID=2903682 RepID=UPI003868B76C|nr:hypothetical protein OG584_30580 [Streptomyces sp. NBC_00859]